MKLFKPTMYKEKGITCLVFDLDNTLGLISHETCPENTKELIEKLKKDFIVIISSNNNKKRLKPYLDELKIDGISWSLKPIPRALIKIKRKYHLEKKEMCMIGDQLVTDVLSGNLFSIFTILVDPLGKEDLKVTGKYDE